MIECYVRILFASPSIAFEKQENYTMTSMEANGK